MGRPQKPNSRRPKKQKINLVFDENKRRDFLCGFHKRKVERRKKAQEDLKQRLKEEKKRIKQENKEAYKKLVVSSRPIPEIEKLLQDEYEDEDVNVKIVELSSAILNKDKWIGENKPNEKVNKPKELNRKGDWQVDTIPGMALYEQSSDNISDEEDTAPKSRKEIKRILKKTATRSIQKSKAFQIKNKMEQIKNKHKSMLKKQRNIKIKDNTKINNNKKHRGGKRKH